MVEGKGLDINPDERGFNGNIEGPARSANMQRTMGREIRNQRFGHHEVEGQSTALAALSERITTQRSPSIHLPAQSKAPQATSHDVAGPHLFTATKD